MTGSDQAASLASVFSAAADMITGRAVAEGAPHDLLTQLGYNDGATSAVENRAALLRAAGGFQRVFTLAADDAPGLVAVGAEVSLAAFGMPDATSGVSGTGATLREAFEACVGEGIEFLSQFISPDDQIDLLPDALVPADAGPAMTALWDRLRSCRRDPLGPAGWTMAADLATGQPVRVPADLCFRRPPEQRDFDPPWALSIGCGAGPDPLHATLHGVLELIERDAVSLWWRAGMRGRLLPPGLGAVMLARLRGSASRRRSWLLDITSDTGVPAVVAASCNDDGFGLCCGHAARPTLAEAADAALLEMAQMELGHQLAEQKSIRRGEAALNAVDRQHVRHYTGINVAATPALQPLAPPGPPHDLPHADQRLTLATIRQRLDALGLSVCVLNLTRSAFGVPVIRALSPSMEIGINAPPGPRLLAVAAATGTDPGACAPI